MSLRSICLGLALLPAVLWFLEPLAAFAATPPAAPRAISISASGPFAADLTGSGGEFQGVLQVQRYLLRAERLYASGLLSGTATDAAGTVVRTLTDRPTTVPLTGLPSGCQFVATTASLGCGAVSVPFEPPRAHP